MQRMIRTLSCLLVILAFVLSLGTFYSPSVHAADKLSRITGHLLDGSNKKAPVAGQRVTLQMSKDGKGSDLTTATTDQQGVYTFTGLDSDPSITYAAYIRYQGADYLSDLVKFDKSKDISIDLTVYQATLDSDKLAVGRATIMIQGANFYRKTVTISQVFVMTNLDNRAYVGSLDASKGKPNALRFALPPGATSVKLDRGFSGYDVIQVSSGFATNAAVPPGDHEFAFSYEVPYTSAVLDMTHHTVYPTLSMMVFVPPDLQFSSNALKQQGTVNIDQDHPYNLFTTSGLRASQDISFRIDGLYMLDDNNGFTLSPIMIWLIVFVVLLIAILGVTWFFIRSSRKAATPTRTVSKSSTSKQSVDATAAKKQSQQNSEERQQALLKDLLTLDREYEDGNLEKEEYEEQRKKLKAELRTLKMKQESVR